MSQTHSTTKHRTLKRLNAFQCGQIEAIMRHNFIEHVETLYPRARIYP